jgi:hypothetical protein
VTLVGKRQIKQIEALMPLVLRYMPLWLGLGTFVIYLLTMSPVLTWEHSGRDGGDLISAAWFLGVPHPTGYPTYTMIAWLFTRLPLGSVAWRVHVFSGVTAAATVSLVYLIGRRLAAGRPPYAALVGSVSGALLLAFSPLFWGHAIIAEVYALHLFFIALVLWLMLRWRDGEGPLWLAALAFGIGMGNHITLTFLGPAILLLLWRGRERLSWRSVLLSAIALAGGLLVLLYMPLRAAADPVINWGDPDDWEGFWWMVSGQGYRRFFFALSRAELLPRLETWLRLTGSQFIPLTWPLALLGLWELARRNHWTALGTFLHAAINLIYSIFYDVSDAYIHLLPVYFYLALWMGQGGVALLVWIRRLGTRDRDTILTDVAIATLLILPLASMIQEWDRMDLGPDQRAHTYALEALETIDSQALLLVGSDAHTFSLWYHHLVEEIRPDALVINYPMLNFDWYRDTVAKYYPEFVLPDKGSSASAKRDAARLNLEQRAVYVTEDEDMITELELTPAGPLWRVTQP